MKKREAVAKAGFLLPKSWPIEIGQLIGQAFDGRGRDPARTRMDWKFEIPFASIGH